MNVYLIYLFILILVSSIYVYDYAVSIHTYCHLIVNSHTCMLCKAYSSVN